MISILVTLTLLLLLFDFIYRWIKERQAYWTTRNVPTAIESFYFLPINKHAGIFFQELYERFKNTGNAFAGSLMFFTPAIFLIDLELIKRVFITDFDSFPDRGFYHNIRDDPLSSNLTRVEGETWRRLRTKLTPTFTSGKMKLMFPSEAVIGERLVMTLRQLVNGQVREIDVRDLSARFTTDVIGTVAFGIECNSLADPHTKFRVLGEKAFSCYYPILEDLASKYPKLFQRLHFTPFSRELIKFYTRIVKETLALRAEKNTRRNDFLDMLIELGSASNDGESVLTTEEIIGQAFVFFIGGYETSSSTLSYCLFELSQNPDVQERARTEIFETLKRFGGELNYECIKEMRYVEQIVQETLRKHPIAPLLRRIVRKRYQIPNTTVILEEGIPVYIPVYGIHNDPAYYPVPEKFDPDRFTPQEVRKRHPMCYLPFGAGPRNCIAERFGKMEVKLGIVMLLKNFRFSPSAKTPMKVRYDLSEKRIFKVPYMFLNVEEL